MKTTRNSAKLLSLLFIINCNVADAAEPISGQKDLQLEALVSGREIAMKVAPIKSEATLEMYNSMTPSKRNPLKALSPAAFERFKSSLTFNENGLTGFSYADLKKELTPEQIDRVFALFGSQDSSHIVKKLSGSKITPSCYLVNPASTSANLDGSVSATPVGSPCDYEGGGGDGYGGGYTGGGSTGGGYAGGWGGGLQFPPPKPYPNGDYGNMYCFQAATCSPRVDFICKNNC